MQRLSNTSDSVAAAAAARHRDTPALSTYASLALVLGIFARISLFSSLPFCCFSAACSRHY